MAESICHLSELHLLLDTAGIWRQVSADIYEALFDFGRNRCCQVTSALTCVCCFFKPCTIDRITQEISLWLHSFELLSLIESKSRFVFMLQLKKMY